MTDYELLYSQVREMILADPWYVSAMSNISALLMDSLPGLNWAGFYLLRGGQLIVGPFQGKPACIHIRTGNGVCGACGERDQAVIVPDVHQFPGHIACDSASKSELVLPIHRGGEVAAVLDLDSPVPDRFREEDLRGLSELAARIEERIRW